MNKLQNSSCLKKICVSYSFAYISSIKDRKQNLKFKNSFTKKPLEFELQNILRNDKKKNNPKTNKLLN